MSSGCTVLHSLTQNSLYESLPYFPIPYNSIGYFQLVDKKSAKNKVQSTVIKTNNFMLLLITTCKSFNGLYSGPF